MNKRFALSLWAALLLGIAVSAKLPVWMAVTGVGFLVAANYNCRKLRVQMIVRGSLLLAFFCLGTLRFTGVEERFSLLHVVPEGEAVNIQGQIYRIEIKNGEYVCYLRQTAILYSDSQKSYVLHPGQVILRTEEDLYPVGSRVQASACMRWMDSATNDGAFDEQKYYNSLGIATVLYVDDVVMLESPKTDFAEKLHQLRVSMREVYEQNLNQKDAGIMCAMILGDKSLMDPELKELYADAGISHILAVSGLHISVIGMGMFRFLRRKKAGYPVSALVSGTCVMLFCLLSGMSVTAMRAGIMFLVFLGASVLGRKYDSFCALALAGIFSLLYNPFFLWNAGFLFSYTAVMGVVGLGGIIKKDKKEAQNTDREVVPGILRTVVGNMKQRAGMSVAVLLATLPLTAYFYYQIPLFSIPANLLILPFTGVLLLTGIAGGLAGVFHLPAGWICLIPCHLLLKFFEHVCQGIQNLHMGTWITGCPGMGWLWIYYLLLIIAAETVCRKKYVCSLLAPVAFLVILFMMPASRQFETVFLDVGQGDGIYINSGNGIHCFVDGGSTSESSVGKYQILPFLTSRRVRSVDLWFLSHGDEDHINGFLEVLQSGYPVKCLVLSADMPKDEAWREVTSCARQYGTKILEVRNGECIRSGELDICCYAAGGDGDDIYEASEKAVADAAEDRNERSLIQLLEYDGCRLLLTGDIASEQEQWLAEQVNLTDIDVLKVAHHGSGYSSGQEFLDTVQPQYAVISCGEKNRYGHPHADTIERLKSVGATIYQTKECGQISLEIQNGIVHIMTVK